MSDNQRQHADYERRQAAMAQFDEDLENVCPRCGEFPLDDRCSDSPAEIVGRLEMFIRAVIADADPERSEYPQMVQLRENRDALVRSLVRASKDLRNRSVREPGSVGDGAER